LILTIDQKQKKFEPIPSYRITLDEMV